MANGDKTTQTEYNATVTNADARAAVSDVWNSQIYEYPPEEDPAKLRSNRLMKIFDCRTIQRRTYNAPVRKRRMSIEMVFVANADAAANMNPPIAAARKTFCRPHVSDKKPMKYDVRAIPKFETPPKNPCSPTDNSKSHLA